MKLESEIPWYVPYSISIVGFLITPFVADFLMADKHSKVIAMGVGLTIIIWVGIYYYIGHDKKEQSINQTDTSSENEMSSDTLKSNLNKPFLIFEDKQSFDRWHQKVIFRLGLPKHPRNALTDKVKEDILLKQFANWKKHPNPNDARVRCGYSEQVPSDLIDTNAEKEFSFIKASFYEIEEMGFVKDTPEISEQETNVGLDREISNYSSPEIPLPNTQLVITPEYNVELVLELKEQTERRNKYLFDWGLYEYKSRISIFLDEINELNIRIIDEKSKAYLVKIKQKLVGKKCRFNLKFAKHPDNSYIYFFVNGVIVAELLYKYRIPFYFHDGYKICVAANIEGTYCARMSMYWANVFVNHDDGARSVMLFDSKRSERIFYSDNEIVMIEDSNSNLLFNRR